MNIRDIEECLTTIASFKAMVIGMFGNNKAKKSFEVYTSAVNHGVFPLHRLRMVEYDNAHDAIYAFCPNHDLDEKVIDVLTKRVADITLNTIQYECIVYLEKWRGGKGSLAYDNTVISSAAPEYPNVVIFSVAHDVDCDYVIYAEKTKDNYVYPITIEQANMIIKAF